MPKLTFLILLVGMLNFESFALNMEQVPWLEQIQRQDLLQHECNRLNLSAKAFKLHQLDHILVDFKHKFLYCYIPKVACTNWKRLLMVLTGKHNATDDILSIPADVAHDESWQTRLSSLPLQKIATILSDDSYILFLMVRHPFERLLSAYRNKFEAYGSSAPPNPSAAYFHSVYGKRILRKYRRRRKNKKHNDANNANNNIKNKGGHVGSNGGNFSNGGGDSFVNTGNYSNEEVVTFKEFAMFLLDEGADGPKVNEHWRSVKELCLPCRLNYTFVGKHETFLEDTKSVLRMIRAPSVAFPHTKSANTAGKLQRYFRQLDLGVLEKLYKLYEADFKLFGYGAENVLGFDFG